MKLDLPRDRRDRREVKWTHALLCRINCRLDVKVAKDDRESKAKVDHGKTARPCQRPRRCAATR